ncbi:MAG: AAA family ATPase, partial [Bacteroidota bacterium]|nr:AAA family ATPase [Bacteroidota bacterium]
KIIQHLVNQELISIFTNIKYKPSFWVREQKNSNSEVDIVLRFKNYIIPIEIKAGKKGRLRSLHQFIDETNHHFAIRIYAGKFNIEETKTPKGTPYYLMNLPYFLTTKIFEYIDFFIKTKDI